MTPSERFAQMLLAKAEGDLAAAMTLANIPDMPDDVVGFHCQQAVEKALKSVLAQSDIDFPSTHDLNELVALLSDADKSSPVEDDEVALLMPWAVELRYDLPAGDPLDRENIVSIADRSVHWARAEVSR